MTASPWRPISPEEADAAEAVLSGSGRRDGLLLARELAEAFVRNTTEWILDVRHDSESVCAANLPDGPFPARAFVSGNDVVRGELIVWVTAGHVSGLEYAWTSDRPPARWPRPEELEIVPA